MWCGRLIRTGVKEKSMPKDMSLAEWLEERQQRFIAMSDDIWAHPQVALDETYACKLQSDFLAGEGFTISSNVGDMPTAFMAEWGSGSPIIGFLGEYDALPGLSQKLQATQDPEVDGGPGHGCGHNLLGTAALAATMALKAWLEETGQQGTVRYYGCPAEETGAGKVFMARTGVFNDLDAALTWHPWANNTVWTASSLAIDHIKFHFHGQTAHAAGAPEHGRSALDAVELMNVGVNYLREHVIQEARIHYVITNGGGQPNVVPDEAEVWYYIRAPKRDQVEEITERVIRIAKGAELMTDTKLSIHDHFGVHNLLPNQVISDVMYDVLKDLGSIDFNDEERAFAKAVAEGYPERIRVAGIRHGNLPESALEQPLLGEVFEPGEKGKVLSGSTDVSEVSWIAPTAQVLTACHPAGVTGHSWGITATGGMSIGHKGMLHAAKVMAVTAAELHRDPSIIARAHDEYVESTGGKPYKAPLPEGAVPPKPYLG
jgi:aminobenzoyl-glutamate utilization protein B